MGFTQLKLILSWFINLSLLTLQLRLTIIFWFLIARTFSLENGRLSSNVYIKKHIDALIDLLIWLLNFCHLLNYNCPKSSFFLAITGTPNRQVHQVWYKFDSPRKKKSGVNKDMFDNCFYFFGFKTSFLENLFGN